MLISIPVALALHSTDVVDTTQLFNPAEHLASYPSGVKYQYDNNVYTNTGDTIPIKDYILADEGGYTNGQIIYKDGVNTVHYYLSGSFAKQPQNYTETQDSGFDIASWTTRYSKLANMPAGFVNNNDADLFNTMPADKIIMSPDGTKYIEIETDASYSYSLSEAYNPSSGTNTGSYLHPVANIKGGTVNEAGTKMLIYSRAYDSNPAYINEIKSLSLPTAWDMDGATVTGTKNMEGFGTFVDTMGIGDVAFNNTGTAVYIFWQDAQNVYRTFIQKFTLSTAWDIDTATFTSEEYFDKLYTLGSLNTHGIITKARFDNSGTELIITSGRVGSYHVHRFSLATAYDAMSTKTLIDVYKTGYKLANVFFNGDNTKLYLHYTDSWNYGTQMVYLPNGRNLGITLYSTDRFEATQVDNTNSILRRWIFMKDVNAESGYRSYAQIYSLTTGSLTVEQMDTTGNTYYTAIDNDSIETMVTYPITDGTNNTFEIRTLIWTSAGIYTRTNQNRYAEFETLSFHSYAPLVSPADIPQFALIGATNRYRPFDNRNYSKAISTATTMSYTVSSTNNSFDTLALGRLKADNVTVVFKLSDGTIIDTINRAIDRTIDPTDNIDGATTTAIFYSSQVMPVGSYVEITMTVTTGFVELGTIMLGQSVDAGFHGLSLNHSYKDFSFAEYDTWGNLDYVEKQRIITYKGSVFIKISDYDRIVRLMLHLGKNLVIVNGSKSKVLEPDSQRVFASTQMIGRFMSFDSRNKITNDDMDRDAEYTFTLEELA